MRRSEEKRKKDTMGSLLKVAVLAAALCACLFVFPVWFPKLTTAAMHINPATPISWGLILAIGLVGGGVVVLKAK